MSGIDRSNFLPALRFGDRFHKSTHTIAVRLNVWHADTSTGFLGSDSPSTKQSATKSLLRHSRFLHSDSEAERTMIAVLGLTIDNRSLYYFRLFHRGAFSMSSNTFR